VELSPAAEDALFALFAVKLDFVSEGSVEKALARQVKLSDGGEAKTVQRLLVESGALTLDQAKAVKAQVDPEVIAGYRIEAEAGRGGMGVVYQAIQLSMERPVAVKVLSRRLSNDEGFVKKFLTEARSAAKLNHEHVVAAIDAGESNGLNYFVMEFVDGESVAPSTTPTPPGWCTAT
jgi:serine/threonine protein kinase